MNVAPVRSVYRQQIVLWRPRRPTAAAVRPRDSLRSEHLDGNAGAVASSRAPPSVRGERAPRGHREATFGLLPSRSATWLELDLRRHPGLCAGRSHVHRPFVYRFAPRFAREWREAGGNPLAVLVPSPSSGAEFEGRPGSSPRRFFCFLAQASPRLALRKRGPPSRSRSPSLGAQGASSLRLGLERWGTSPSGVTSAPSRARGAWAASGQYAFVCTIQYTLSLDVSEDRNLHSNVVLLYKGSGARPRVVAEHRASTQARPRPRSTLLRVRREPIHSNISEHAALTARELPARVDPRAFVPMLLDGRAPASYAV